MLELALGTPEVGCANLNMLYTLLRHMLLLMKIHDSPVTLETLPPSEQQQAKIGGSDAASVTAADFGATPLHALTKQVAQLQSGECYCCILISEC